MYMYAVPGGSPMADALFTRTRQRVLGVLFGYPRRSFHISDIAWRSGTGFGAVYRVLASFEAAGLLTTEERGNQRHFQANPECPIFVELCAIAVKTVGVADPVRNALLHLRDRIIAAFLRPGRNDHGIGIVIVARGLRYGDAEDALAPARAFLGREIWFDLLEPSEWDRRRREFEGEKVFVVGDKWAIL